MMNLLPHRRLHISNTLAIFAAVLLLVTSVVGFESNQETYTTSEVVKTSIKVNANENSINETATQKRRGLNLGLLLFRRG